MRPAISRAHGKLENFRVVETRRDVTTFSLETLRVANHSAARSVNQTVTPVAQMPIPTFSKVALLQKVLLYDLT